MLLEVLVVALLPLRLQSVLGLLDVVLSLEDLVCAVEVVDAVDEQMKEDETYGFGPVREKFRGGVFDEDFTADLAMLHGEERVVVVDHPEAGGDDLSMVTLEQHDADAVEEGHVIEIGREGLVQCTRLLQQHVDQP
jgi:hypothetical protein